MTKPSPVQVAQVIEIRARHDRNRLLAIYDRAKAELKFFHRGRVIVVRLDELDALASSIETCYTKEVPPEH